MLPKKNPRVSIYFLINNMIKESAFLKTVGKKMNNTYNSISQGSNVFQAPWSKKYTHPNTVYVVKF